MPGPELVVSKRPVKYYVYLSRRKVDMFYQQIPGHLLQKISGNLTIELPIVKIGVGKSAPEPGYYLKLAIVLDYIEKEFGFGTVDGPGAYFRGEVPVYWGPYREREDDNSSLVFFGGKNRHYYPWAGRIDRARHRCEIEQRVALTVKHAVASRRTPQRGGASGEVSQAPECPRKRGRPQNCASSCGSSRQQHE